MEDDNKNPATAKCEDTTVERPEKGNPTDLVLRLIGGLALHLALGLVLGLGMTGLTNQVALAEYNSMLAPTNFTPSSYIAPKYDAFDHDYYRVPQTSKENDLPPLADFNIYNKDPGLPRPSSGTTKTEFIFDANASTDPDDDSSTLEVRWDFENDGKLDSYFSRTKSIRHLYSKPGTYNVKLEVLDRGGNISSIVKTVTVVDNTSPIPFFIYAPASGTGGMIFRFDTRFSRSDQYLLTYLQYRFDWNGDSKWDTSFENKTSWNHRFETAGTRHVILEVKDPADQRATFARDLKISDNESPKAQFEIKTISNGSATTYEFDASKSDDLETKHNRLQFRWDFDYNGKDDIVTDSEFSFADLASHTYYLGGAKTIRLEVRDEDGAISFSSATVEVPWTSAIVNQLLKYL